MEYAYFLRDDGGTSQVNKTTNPSDYKWYKEHYVEITKEQYDERNPQEDLNNI